MARTNIVKNFDLSFEINFNTIIRGHHVYESIWTSSIEQVLLALPDVRKEDLDYDKYVVDISKRHEEDFSHLGIVGHAPHVEIIGKRKCEVGLVVPAKFSARTECSQMGKVLDEQLLIPFILFIEGHLKKWWALNRISIVPENNKPARKACQSQDWNVHIPDDKPPENSKDQFLREIVDIASIATHGR